MTAATDTEKDLDAAQRAFDLGRYEELRTLIEPLVKSDNVKKREAALVLRERIAIDPAQLWVIGVSFLFFLLIAYKYVF